MLAGVMFGCLSDFTLGGGAVRSGGLPVRQDIRSCWRSSCDMYVSSRRQRLVFREPGQRDGIDRVGRPFIAASGDFPVHPWLILQLSSNMCRSRPRCLWKNCRSIRQAEGVSEAGKNGTGGFGVVGGKRRSPVHRGWMGNGKDSQIRSIFPDQVEVRSGSEVTTKAV